MELQQLSPQVKVQLLYAYTEYCGGALDIDTYPISLEDWLTTVDCAMSVCDTCEEEYPMFMILENGICPLCKHKHTY